MKGHVGPPAAPHPRTPALSIQNILYHLLTSRVFFGCRGAVVPSFEAFFPLMISATETFFRSTCVNLQIAELRDFFAMQNEVGAGDVFARAARLCEPL